MYRANNETETNPKASKGWKFRHIKINLGKNRYYYRQWYRHRRLTSDPNAMLERLDLLMASKAAGNAGTKNEFVSICKELLTQNVIYELNYKKNMLQL